VDAGVIRVVKLQNGSQDLGWVGDPTETNKAPLELLLSARITPVVSPISLGQDGHTYNVNADHAAAALSRALDADELVFVTNVPGVFSQEGQDCLAALTPQEVESLISSGIIEGGMVPKVRSALAALTQGVSHVRITNLKGLATEGGTCFYLN
jgi:acetylglutamate kinase